MEGFYYDTYRSYSGIDMDFLATQFAPIGARYAFPSFDEPYFRAQFKIIIIRPKEYTCVISNAELKQSNPRYDLIEDEFKLTNHISPSSLVFTVSKLQISPKVNGCIHQIVAQPEILKDRLHEYPLTLINRIYPEIEKFLQVGCELKRLYHVAIPSNRIRFESLGSYRGVNHYEERKLVFQSTTMENLKEVAIIAMTKLMAQQWFLSYLMVDSWTWAWVNEGLTHHLSYNITDKFYPEWQISERLLHETRLAMYEDSRCCCESLDKEVRTSAEIKGKFNQITAFKGTALIIMMERIVPEKCFKKGLTNLIKAAKWSTYNSKSLYDQIETNLKINNFYGKSNLPNTLNKIMSTWETQMGYPVLTVKRNYDGNDLDRVGISQMRFYVENLKSKPVWTIPINYATEFNPNFTNTRPTDWLNVSSGIIIIKSLKKTDWLILNNQATYYYRVNYDAKNWKAISEALRTDHKVIHLLNRMQIIDDAFSLAEVGMLNYSIALEISKYIKYETDFGPLSIMREVYQSISKKLAGKPVYLTFQKFISKSVENVFDYFELLLSNSSNTPNETNHRIYRTRQLLLFWLCELNSQNCDIISDQQEESLRSALRNDADIYRFCGTQRKHNGNKWDRSFYKYQSHNDSFESRTLNALGCKVAPSLQERFLHFVMTSEEDNLFLSIKLVIRQRKHGMHVAIKFISEYFNYLLKEFEYKQMSYILNDVGSRVSTQKQLDNLLQLSKRHPGHGQLINPCVSRAKNNLRWRKKHLGSFESYFKDNRSIGIKHYINMHAIILIILSFILC